MIALSLVFFGANYAGFAYQTLGLLVFAYVVRFLPQAVASCTPRSCASTRGSKRRPAGWARARGARHCDDPARHAGAARRRRAGLPLDDEGAPATPARAPIGFDTPVTEVWTATTVAAYSEAALPALLLVVFSAPFVYVLTVRRGPGVDAPG